MTFSIRVSLYSRDKFAFLVKQNILIKISTVRYVFAKNGITASAELEGIYLYKSTIINALVFVNASGLVCDLLAAFTTFYYDVIAK